MTASSSDTKGPRDAWQPRRYPVCEIFYSLQGEGTHTGMPAVFLRFSGCNLRCPFCDTDHSRSVPMTAREIVERIAAFPAHTVILTGGEPALHIDSPLIEALRSAGLRIHIETNGTLPLPPGIDWVTLSPKGAPLALTEADEVKVVYQGSDPRELCKGIRTARLLLQPCSGENIPQTVEWVMAHPDWRLSLQTHKLISIQ